MQTKGSGDEKCQELLVCLRKKAVFFNNSRVESMLSTESAKGVKARSTTCRRQLNDCVNELQLVNNEFEEYGIT